MRGDAARVGGGEATKAALQKDASAVVETILSVRYVPAWSLAPTASHAWWSSVRPSST